MLCAASGAVSEAMRAASRSAAWKAASGAASGNDAGEVKERGVPFIFPRRPLIVSGSSEQRGVFLSGGPPVSSPFCLGAVLLFPLSTLLFPALSTLVRHFPHSSILPRVLQTFFSFCPGTPPRLRAIPSHLVLIFPPSSQSAASRFPPEAEALQPAFPARGMLAQFPHAFAGGRFSPSWASSGPVIPSRGGGQVASSHFLPIRKRSSRRGRCDARA
jgi:hypothetical protein